MSILIKGITKEDVIGLKSVFRDKVVVLPPHGRLIDADALTKTENPIHKSMVFGGEYVYTQSAIDNAPTIIEAEVDNEHTD